MINAQDLHIEAEIKPLFDFTYSNHSGNEVREILMKTLDSKEEILFRQQLLRGFIANWEILKDYSYYRFNLSEIYDFLETILEQSVSPGKLRLRFMFSEKSRKQKRGKLILLMCFSHLTKLIFRWRVSFEIKTWFDMVCLRKTLNLVTGKFVDMIGYRLVYGTTYTEKNLLFPIPSSEILNYKKLIQNQGY